MKKVGILSMQRIYNYGSFLQAYGLKQMVTELGGRVEFVDYHPGQCLIPIKGGHGVSRTFSKVIEVIKYKAPVKEKLKFIKYKKNYAKNYYPYLGIGNVRNYSPDLDLLIIGSDEVFNCVQNNTNVGFTLELFGDQNNTKRLISYAASFGNTTYLKLKKYNIDDKISHYLKKFDAISVRDDNSRDVVKKLTDINAHYHLDPVLAYDFMGKCKEIPEKLSECNYMIVYGYSGRLNNEECTAIRNYAKTKKLKVFCIGGVQNCCDKFIDCSPFEVLAYFKNAHSIVTDTFHGTIMSVITHRPFASIVRSSGYGNSEKMTDLLRRLRLEDRIVNKIDDLQKILEKTIDYKITDQIIIKERERSYDYLNKELLQS